MSMSQDRQAQDLTSRGSALTPPKIRLGLTTSVQLIFYYQFGVVNNAQIRDFFSFRWLASPSLLINIIDCD